MFCKILKKDLKRKKTMNILLLLFITLTATLLGASIHMFSTNSIVLRRFMEKSNTVDFCAINHNTKENQKKTEQWLTSSNLIEDYTIETVFLLMKDNITLPAGKKALDFDNAMTLQAVPDKSNLVFDESNQLMEVKEGEIAIPYYIAQMTDLEIGDTITITLEGRTKEFTIGHYVKDAFCGSSMMGIKRWFINEKDYEYFNQTKVTKFDVTNVKFDVTNVYKTATATEEEVSKEFNQLGITTLSTVTKNVIETSYLLNSIIAGVIMIISILLILISFLILRFTIRFTLQEDNKEIGIMKAIGIKNRAIQSIYMVKYLAIGLFGGGIGYLLSIPLGAFFINMLCDEMVTENVSLVSIPSLIGVLLIVFMTLAFCRICTRRLNKFSAITAIRGGSTGETYYKTKRIHLKKWKGRSSTFLAISDLLHGGKKHIALILSFIFGTMILIVTLNIVNTMKSNELMKLFGYTNFDFAVVPPNVEKIIFTYTTQEMLDYVEDLEKEYNAAGIPVELYPEVNYMSKVYKDDKADCKNIFSLKSYGVDTNEYSMEEGVAPKLPNEVAVSSILAEYYKVGVGDYLTIQTGQIEKQYIITGIYISMINIGENIRLPQEGSYEMKGSSGFGIMGRYKGKESQEVYISKLSKVKGENDIKTAMDYMQEMMGNITDSLDELNTGILVLVICVNFIITMLVGKMLVTREAPEIAVLKSLGYKNKSIRSWQMKRMAILLLFSIFVGTILANILGRPIALGIFESVGVSSLHLTIDLLQVFVLYPAIILGFTLLATIISTRDIKKIQVWEFNNQE